MINRWGNSIHESYTYDAYDNTTSIAYTYSESPTEMLSEGGTIESNGGNNDEPDAMALSGTQTLFQTNFAWNGNSGNMTWRENPLAGVEETFEYDDLNRLVSIEVDNGSLLSYTISMPK